MQDINRMGLRVVGITAVVLVVLFGLYLGGKALLSEDKAIEGGDEENLTLSERQKDSDGDGVADLYETAYYKTDPKKADTDGDGTNDLDEIIAGRNPLLAGPNDSVKPATGAAVATQDTFTKKYLAQLPTDAERESVLDQTKLELFVEENKGVLLPTLPAGTVKTASGEGGDAISLYLDNISAAHNTSLTIISSADIEAAFRLKVDSQLSQAMEDLVRALSSNVSILENVAVPQESISLHTSLLQASRSLRDNTKLLADIDKDFVGGLIGAKNIESLGAVFQVISQGVQGLEAKYGIE